MVAHKTSNVKTPCEECGRMHGTHWEKLWCWVDCHPRYWWFWTIMLLINTMLNLLDIAGFGNH